MEEIWKDVIGFEGLYKVSNLGRVKSIDRVKPCILNGVERLCLHNGRILKFTKDAAGYFSISLSLNGKIKTYRIHRLVALAFLPNPENKKTVNHKDGNKENNNECNLEWATYLENNTHANQTGLNVRKSRKGTPSKKNIQQFDIDGTFLKNWDSASQASRELGFAQTCISRCVIGKVKTSYGYVWKEKRESI